METELAYALEGLTFFLLLGVGWWQASKYKTKAREARRQAILAGNAIVRNSRSECDDGARILIDHGIRSWRHRQDRQWVLLVDAENRVEAQRLLHQVPCAA